jgi:hypothetical protein
MPEVHRAAGMRPLDAGRPLQGTYLNFYEIVKCLETSKPGPAHGFCG